MTEKNYDHFLEADEKTDSAVTMKKMIPVKILKSTWLVLFAEIIVSDKGMFDIVKLKRRRTSFLLISRFFLKLGANSEPAAHRQCARDAKSFKSSDGKAEI